IQVCGDLPVSASIERLSVMRATAAAIALGHCSDRPGEMLEHGKAAAIELSDVIVDEPAVDGLGSERVDLLRVHRASIQNAPHWSFLLKQGRYVLDDITVSGPAQSNICG